MSSASRTTIRVPWSSGEDALGVALPAGATDCHHHLYDGRLTTDGRSRRVHADASLDDYRLLQRRLGISRHVLVQPSVYGSDNTGLLAGLAACPAGTARGVAVGSPAVPEAELARWHALGVRGLRFNLIDRTEEGQLAQLAELAPRVAALGWHVQINASARQICGAEALWHRLPCAVVFDHLGHLPQPSADAHPAFALLVSLMRQGLAWVKLTGLYNTSLKGAPDYEDAASVARAFMQGAPDRVVWGSDWPHPTETSKPDDAQLLRLLLRWADTAELRQAILVGNPAKLYDFG
jgi:predicted TIM-barrel fold metal-dependent hydrolase